VCGKRRLALQFQIRIWNQAQRGGWPTCLHRGLSGAKFLHSVWRDTGRLLDVVNSWLDLLCVAPFFEGHFSKCRVLPQPVADLNRFLQGIVLRSNDALGNEWQRKLPPDDFQLCPIAPTAPTVSRENRYLRSLWPDASR